MSVPALAQTAAETKGETAKSAEIEELVVTGSRLKRSNFNSPAPITVITTENSALQGLVDTGAILQGSTIASTAVQIDNNFTGFNTVGGAGVNSLSLRGLGAQRTLFVIDGKRAGPAGVGGQVGPFDLNTVPASMVDRFEILKDGASSIYGSDAVAGVVNVITKKNNDNAELNVYGNVPFESGGQVYRVSGSKGWTWSRGHVQVGLDYFTMRGLRYSDRDYLACPVDYAFDPQTGARLDLIDPKTGTFACVNTANAVITKSSTTTSGTGASPSGRFIIDPTATADGFNLNGYRAVNRGTGTPGAFNGSTGAYGTGLYGRNVVTNQAQYLSFVPACAGQTNQTALTASCTAGILAFARSTQAAQPTDSPFMRRRHAVSPVDRYTFFGNGAFDLTPTVQVYGDLLLNRRDSAQDTVRQLFPTVNAANPSNPFNPAANPNYTGPASNAQPVILLPSDKKQTVDYARVVIGLRGDLPDTFGFLSNWSWDIYGQYAKSSADYEQQFIYNDRVNATIGTSACNPALITISNTPGLACTPVNYFKAATLNSGQFTSDEAAFLFGNEKGHTDYTHQYVEASLSGDLFTLPAGKVAAAVGVQLRKEELNDTPGYNARNSNYWGATTSGITRGSDTITEVFGEVEVPVLKGMRFADSLTINLSDRYSDYDSYGGSNTYKVGVNWQIVPAFRLRATKGTSFRAPALYELYLANQTGFLSQAAVDICYQYGTNPQVTSRQAANCAAIGLAPTYNAANASGATITAGGGKGYLKAEDSDAWTVGAVWTPSFTDLRVALDYSEITINNQVQQFGAANIVSQCFDSGSFPNNLYCSLIQRDTTAGSPTFGMITGITNNYLNVAKQWSHNIDLEAQYRHDFPLGRLSITSQFTWVLDWYTQLQSTMRPTKNQGFTGYPDFTGTINARFDHEDWTFAWATQMYGKTSDVDDAYSGYGTDTVPYRDQTAYLKRHLEFVAYHDLSVRKKFDTFSVTVGVQNVFDNPPPFYSTSSLNRISNMRLASQYDLIGRRAFFEINKRW